MEATEAKITQKGDRKVKKETQREWEEKSRKDVETTSRAAK